MAVAHMHMETVSSLDHTVKEGRIQKLVRSNKFDAVLAVFVATNALWIGWQVEYKAKQETLTVPWSYKVIDIVFIAVFTAELYLRFMADGVRVFFTSSEDLRWNWFDFLVLVFGSVEVVISLAAPNNDTFGNVSVLRVIRICRIIRVFRIIRVLRFFRSLRILVAAILGTLKSCVWTALLLSVIMYVFGIIFAQMATEYIITHEWPKGYDKEKLRFYYGTMPRAVFTLFKAIVGGIDWEMAVLPLSDVSWVLVLLFIFFIAFVNLAVMNVVTGLFLQSALEQAQQDRDHVIQQQLTMKNHYIASIRKLFEELDTSGDGSITLNEFEDHLGEERMQAFLHTIEIDTADAWTFFKLLDADGGGSVDIDEFVEGCLRLRGNAKSIHVAQMMYENKWIMDKLVELSGQLRCVGCGVE